jgi:hypothetical protein
VPYRKGSTDLSSEVIEFGSGHPIVKAIDYLLGYFYGLDEFGV